MVFRYPTCPHCGKGGDTLAIRRVLDEDDGHKALIGWCWACDDAVDEDTFDQLDLSAEDLLWLKATEGDTVQ